MDTDGCVDKNCKHTIVHYENQPHYSCQLACGTEAFKCREATELEAVISRLKGNNFGVKEVEWWINYLSALNHVATVVVSTPEPIGSLPSKA